MEKKLGAKSMDGPNVDYDRAAIDRSEREQNRFLDHCCDNRIEVTIFLQSGTQFIGMVREHDRKCILLGGRSRAKEPRLIMKSYIALIRPNQPIELFLAYRGMGTALQRKKRKEAGGERSWVKAPLNTSTPRKPVIHIKKASRLLDH